VSVVFLENINVFLLAIFVGFVFPRPLSSLGKSGVKPH